MEKKEETDKQFVERIFSGEAFGKVLRFNEDVRRLRALALRGAETQWRPIEEAPKDGTWLLLSKWVGHTSHPTALWWVVRGCWSLKWNKWWDGIEPCGLVPPTRFIPLSALGEPPRQHVLFQTGDADAPQAILDRNGEVVLAMCRHCRKGEIELDEQPYCLEIPQPRPSSKR